MMKAILGALLLVAIALVVLTLRGLRDDPKPSSVAREPTTTPATSEQRATHAETAAATATTGTIPVEAIAPPKPDPAQPMPRAPVEPPNPAVHRPAMDNPGGVNGDRPER